MSGQSPVGHRAGLDYEAETCAKCGYKIGYMEPAKADGKKAYHKRCL